MGKVLDYSHHVEVVAQESYGAIHAYAPSDGDLARLSSRFARFFGHDHTMPTSSVGREVSPVPLRAHEVHAAIQSRVGLFNAIEDTTVPDTANSLGRSLKDWMGSTCYLCSKPTTIVRDELADTHPKQLRIRACSACGWWESEHLVYSRHSPDDEKYIVHRLLRRSLLREFAILDESAPIDAIRQHLLRHCGDLNRLSPRQLEKLVGSVFSDFFDCEALHVGGPGDGGVDLVLLLSDCNAVVQVKQRRDASRAESVSTIRDFLGAMLLGDTRVGFVVSTARTFSGHAVAAAAAAPPPVIERLELIDATRLLDILKLVSANTCPALVYGPSFADPVPDYSPESGFTLLQILP
jgi:hypothetical protein